MIQANLVNIRPAYFVSCGAEPNKRRLMLTTATQQWRVKP